MGEKREKSVKAAVAAAEVERVKKICSNCGKVGSSGEKNFSKCAFCELTRYCSRDCQKAHWKARLTRSDSLFNTTNPNVHLFAPCRSTRRNAKGCLSKVDSRRRS